MVKLGILLFFIGIITNTKSDSDMNGTSACIIKTSGFCLPKGYEKFEGPEQTKGGPIHVKVKFMVQQITHINDDDFTISVSMSLHLYWEDPRITNLHSGSFQEEHHDHHHEIIPLSFDWVEKLWLPDVYVENMKSAYETRIIQPFGSNI